MKIAIIAPSPVPFLIGGAEKFFWGLQHHCNQLTSHDVELIKVPCSDHRFWGLMEGYQRFSQLDLSYFDAVISTKYPAWITPHPNHHLYMQHKCRGLYDLYRGPAPDLSTLPAALDPVLRIVTGPADRGLLETFFAELFRLRNRPDIPEHWFSMPSAFTIPVVHWLDDVALNQGAIGSYSAISKNVATRNRYFPPGVSPRIIHHPSDLKGLHCREYKHIFTASRLADLKRVDLLVRAMLRVEGDIEFRIAGTGAEEQALAELAKGDKRINFLGFVNDATLMAEYANALFVPFVPMDEDYGLITIEAMQSSKAVLTSHDSGGVNEFVEHGVNGLIVDPQPEAIALAMQSLVSNRAQTERMGEMALATAAVITWENTVGPLMEQVEQAAPKKSAFHSVGAPSTARFEPGIAAWRPLPPEGDQRERVVSKGLKKVVVASTFPVYPPTSGGQARIYNLYRRLCPYTAGLRLVSLADQHGSVRKQTIAPGLEEVTIPMSAAHAALAERLGKELGVSCGDIACIDGYHLTPRYTEELAASCAEADLVILSHPYMYRAVRSVCNKPIWYDAHNVEVDMKRALFGQETPSAKAWVAATFNVERDCCREAEAILVCSERDGVKLAELYGAEAANIHIATNGVDFDSILELPAAARQDLRRRLDLDRKTVFLFIGSWHGPNIEGAEQVKRWAGQVPEALFLVVGSVCGVPQLGNNLPDNMLLLGVLSEREKAVVCHLADVALNPTTTGSGTNLKMLEYAAWGLPIISTPYGNRGLDFSDPDHIVLAQLEAFPARLKALVADGRQALAARGIKAKALARERYDWQAIAAAIGPLLGA